MKYYTSTLSLLVTALKKVATNVVKDFHELSYLSSRSDQTGSGFSSNVLTFLQKKLLEDVGKIKSSYSFILPNGDIIANKDASNYVVLSAIPGFNNYKRSLPEFVLALALVRDNQAWSGVVLQPLLDHLYVAEQGHGAYFNRQKLKSGSSPLSRELLIASDHEPQLSSERHSISYRNTGCATLDLCNLAASNLDACIYTQPLNYTEVLPGILVAQQAGCKVDYDINANTITNLTASNPLVAELLDL